MSQPITFDVQVDQNDYLPAGGAVMNAAIAVTAAGVGLGPTPTAAQVIMVDCSGSMAGPKLVEAKRATSVAIDTLRDGVAFAVVSGTHEATTVYPDRMRMVAAAADTREQAKAAVRGLRANGGTAIGRWLELANRLLADRDEQIKHGILLTDGHNEHEAPEELRRTLERCRDNFVCDSRGVGTGWEAKPLLEIADVLLGSARGLTEPGELAADFKKITENVMGKAAANVSLRLWTLPEAKVRFLKQIHPRIVDLTGRGTAAGARAVDYPTGQWGAETREFHLCVEVPVGAAGEPPVRVAKVSVVCGTDQSAASLVRARWTEDPALSTKLNPRVAHLTGQNAIAENINAGVEALKRGDIDVATAKLSRALKGAEESGHEDTARLLRQVVDDTPTGTARLRRDVPNVHVESLEIQGPITTSSRRRSEPAPEPVAPGGGTAVTIHLADETHRASIEGVVASFLRDWDGTTETVGASLPPVVAALRSTQDAVVRAGELLIVQVAGTISVHQLTRGQQLRLDHQRNLTARPETIHAALGLRPDDSLWPPKAGSR